MTDEEYVKETINHIKFVEALMLAFSEELKTISHLHDLTKLYEPEKSGFREVIDKLKSLTYGSPEYNAQLEQLGSVTAAHYARNRHHPEHFVEGIRGMTLLNLIEMFCDWYAASYRHSDGDIYRSIEVNQSRFGYSDDIKKILTNTVKFLGALDFLERPK